MSPRATKTILLAILCAGCALRMVGLHFGLPTTTHTLATYHPDESIQLYSLERMNPSKLDFYPGDALYWGSFHIYLQGALTKLASLAGYLTLGNREYLLAHLHEADKLYIIGRMISIVFGSGSILVFFLIVKKMYGSKGGLIGALILAVTPIAVVVSLYAKPDAVMLFWYLASIFAAMKAVENQERKYFLLYGVMLGLATVSKYSGVLSLGFFILLHFITIIRRRLPIRSNGFSIILMLCCAALTYLLVNPYAVLRFPDFFRYANGMIVAKTTVPSFTLSHYLEYFFGVLPAAMGWAVFLASLAGMALMFFEWTAAEASMFVFTLFFIIRLGPAQSQGLNYCLPMLPFLIIFAVKALLRVSAWPWGRFAAGIVILYTAIYSVEYKLLFTGQDPRVQASGWIEANIPRTAVFALTKSDFWTPPILKEYQPAYHILFGRPPQSPLSDAVIALGDIAQKADYVVLTSHEYADFFHSPGSYPRENTVLKGIMERDFTNVKCFYRRIALFGIPFYKSDIRLDWMFPNPTVCVFKRK